MIADDLFEDFQTRYYALYQALPVGDGIGRHVASQLSDGSWPDIDYTGHMDWTPSTHAKRLSYLSRAYAHEGRPLAADPATLTAIIRGVDYWLRTPVVAANWWYNSVGIPCDMAVVGMLLSKDLGADRMAGLLSILDQAGKPSISGDPPTWIPFNERPGSYAAGSPTGANLVWLARINLHCACLRRDHDLFAKCLKLIWGEVKIGAAEGIQLDGTFYQHGARLQNFHYGLAFFEHVIELAWLLRDTPFEMPEDKRRIITFRILEGDRWMCRGSMTVPGTLDRASTRPGYLRVSTLARFLKLWRDVVPDASIDLDPFISAQSDGSAVVRGFRHFPYGDFSSYHQPGFSIFLKTISTRTELSESINTENLCGVPYLNCGDHYLIRHGDEHHDMPPVWDWSALPGLTASTRTTLPIRKQCVGGVGDGVSGYSVMDSARRETESPIDWSVRKFWAFHGGMMICLIGGWDIAPEAGDPITTLEQCRRFGPVHVRGGDDVYALPDGDHNPDDVRWVMHRGVGYVPIRLSSMRIELAGVEGSWKRINASYPDEPPVHEERFLLQMRHPRPASGAGYAVVCNADGELLDALTGNPPWTIPANDESRQCIRFADGMIMAAFYASGAIEADNGILSADRSCLVLCGSNGAWASDPNHAGGWISVTCRGESYGGDLPSDGRSVPLIRTM